MENSKGLQQLFLQQIKDRIQFNLSFVDEIAEVLAISTDSTYRRIRGETTLTFEEIEKLSRKFGVSVDNLFGNSQDLVTFHYRAINSENFTFDDYLESILGNLQAINKFDNKELIYAAKDIPLFHHLLFRELAAFKIFFWSKTILQYPEFDDKQFDPGHIKEETLNIGDKIAKAYIQAPSVEIWSNETIITTLRQIEFYWECGLFSNDNLAIQLCRQVEQLILHLKKQAEKGHKFMPGETYEGLDSNFKLYYNEVTISDNTIFFVMGDTKITYITHNVLDILTTSNSQFCDQTHHSINNIIKKSSLISSVSEKERNKFFRSMNDKITDLRDKISI